MVARSDLEMLHFSGSVAAASRLSERRYDEILTLAGHTLDAYERKAEMPPVMRSRQDHFETEEAARLSDAVAVWMQASPSLRILRTENSTVLNKKKGISRVTIGGASKIFRSRHDGTDATDSATRANHAAWENFRDYPVTNLELIRKTLAAAMLNRLIGLDTVPLAVPALVDGMLGVLSDDAGGNSGATFGRRDLNVRSLCDALAFEFWVGNSDVHDENWRRLANGKIKAFDHDWAFVTGLAVYFAPHRFGATLPDYYTPRFIAGIRNAMPECVLRELGPLLTEEERIGLEFRRQMILRDIEARPPLPAYY